MRFLHKVSAVLAFASLSGAAAETGSLTGWVLDDQGLPLPGANVMIVGQNTGAATDRAGEFRIGALPAGAQTVVVSFMGFGEFRQQVNIAPGATTALKVTMTPAVLEMGEVVLVGEHLKGQAKALNQQMTNANVSQIISADQIGRFPDQNIGDALKRAPAVAVNYDQGEARYVNIRGIEPRLNSVALDGERLPSPDAETRAVQLDMISSEMIQTIEVNKTLTPDMDADAIGGSVNLVTRPAVYLRRFSATLGSGYNALTGKPMLNGSFVAGRRFFEEKLGLSLSGSTFDHRLGSHNSEGIWSFDENGAIYPSQWDVRRYEVRRLRTGLAVNLDYRPEERDRFMLSLLFNRRFDWETRARLRYRLQPPNKNMTAKDSEVRRQTKAGVADHDNARLEDQQLLSLRLKGKHDLPNLVVVEWTASYSRARELRPHERYLQWWVNKTDVKVNLDDLRTPYFSVNLPDSSFKLEEITEEFRTVTERDGRLAVDIDVPMIRGGKFENLLQIGGKLKAIDKQSTIDGWRISLTSEGKAQFRNMTKTTLADFSQDDFLAGNYRIGSFTAPAYLGALNFDDEQLFRKRALADVYGTQNYVADESVSSAYLMIDQKIGNKMAAIAGVRVERTGLRYTGFEQVEEAEGLTATTGSSHYADWLPSLHLIYRPRERMVLRFAYTNAIARPNFYDLVPYRQLSRGREVLRVGNPQLLPTTSENLDFSFEWYDRTVGLASFGIFNKNLDRFYYVHRENGVIDPVTGKKVSEFYQPRNGGRADLHGVELAFQRQLGFLPGFLSKLGVYVNYTRVYSNAAYPSFPNRRIPLPGAAPQALNLNLSYESKRLTLGLSFNYAAANLDPKQIDLTPGLERWYDQVTYLDFNGSWRIKKNWRAYWEANNLLNQPLRYYAGTPERTFLQEFYGLRMTAGLKFNL